MKTEAIEGCIQYVEHMLALGQLDPSRKGAEKARAELAALKEENERLRKVLEAMRTAALNDNRGLSAALEATESVLGGNND